MQLNEIEITYNNNWSIDLRMPILCISLYLKATQTTRVVEFKGPFTSTQLN